ncbi:uncharacterized protein LOC126570679 [Anopheles aquasalis]|uniref:uncharacterized protein LOC126570679 n=1 Tax=Anopheles aquasalis TaxID=42839 RepID=UPI00215A99D1|nr:uncharacterized protein LOC126570679 [Anopheles aquasalis]
MFHRSNSATPRTLFSCTSRDYYVYQVTSPAPPPPPPPVQDDIKGTKVGRTGNGGNITPGSEKRIIGSLAALNCRRLDAGDDEDTDTEDGYMVERSLPELQHSYSSSSSSATSCSTSSTGGHSFTSSSNTSCQSIPRNWLELVGPKIPFPFRKRTLVLM